MSTKVIILALSLAAVCAASGITLDATGLPSAYESGDYSPSGATYNGFIGATINGIANQLIICDDFSHETDVPSGDMAYDFSTIGGPLSLTNARFNGPSMLQSYEEAAVLVADLSNYVAMGGSHASANRITDYQYALWNIFDSNVSVNANQANLQSAALMEVNTDASYLAANVYPYIRIYTPDPAGSSTGSQEFLQYVAPEPGTIFLTAGALLIALGVRRRRRRVA